MDFFGNFFQIFGNTISTPNCPEVVQSTTETVTNVVNQLPNATEFFANLLKFFRIGC